jgi:putative hydrolase of the HAD superfamily
MKYFTKKRENNFLRYNHIIFDLDGTLYDEFDYFRSAFKKISLMIVHDFPEFNEEEIYNDIVDDFTMKGSQYKNFFNYLSHQYYGNDSKGKDFFEIYCSIDADIHLYSDFDHIIKFKESNLITLSIITNGTIIAQKNKIKLLDLHKYFDFICVARELGDDCEKPNSIGYKYILDISHSKVSEVIYVGDNPHNDFQGAKKIGIATVRFLRGEFANIIINDDLVDHTVKNHEELISIIVDNYCGLPS